MKPLFPLLASSLLACAFVSPVVFAAAPTAVADARAVPVDTPITINVLNNDVDTDGDTLSIISAGPANNGSVDIIGGGSLRYDPAPGFSGTDSFTYTISDGQETAEATVTVRVSDDILSPLSRTGNDRSVGASLDAACAVLLKQSPSALSIGANQLRDGCESLRNLAVTDTSAAARAVNRIAPEETMALIQTAAKGAQSHTDAVSSRLLNVGQGINAITVNGLAVYQNNQARGAGAGDDLWSSKLGFFASVQTESADKKITAHENGFDYDADAVTVGADYKITSDWIVGGGIGWTENNLKYKQGDGVVDAKITSLILYSSYHFNNITADIQLGRSTSDYDIYRDLSYGIPGNQTSITSRGRTHGEQDFIRLQVQYAFSYKAFSFFPQIKLDHVDNRIDAYDEVSAGGFEVSLSEQEMRSSTLHIGVQSQYALNYDWGVLVPSLDVFWMGEVKSDQDMIHGHFSFAPGNTPGFVLAAEAEDTSFFNARLGASAVFPGGVSAFVSYDKMLGYSDFKTDRVELGARYEF